MHTARQIAKNSFVYTLALIIQKAFSTVYFWYYSNNLIGGAADLGRLQFVLSFVALFFIIGDLGLYLVFLREASRTPEKANKYLNTLLAIKIPLILLASLVILTVGALFYTPNLNLILLALIWIALDNLTILLYGILRARQNMKYESIAVIVIQLIVISFGATSILLSGEIIYLIMALIVGTGLNFLFVLSLVVFKLKFKIRIHYDPAVGKFILKSLPAFALAGIVIKILNSVDVVLLQKLVNDFQVVGLYSIPLRLINAVSLTVPTALMGAVYPALSHLYKKSEEGLHRVFQYAMEYLLIISIPLSLGFLALGDEFIQTLWQDEFIPAIIPAKIMLLSLPFIFLAFPTGNLLNATHRQKYTALSRIFGVIALIGLNIILVPQLGLIGAAIALVGTHIVILGSDVFFLRKRFKKIVGHLALQFAKILFGALMMYLLIQFLSAYIAWYLLMFIGALVYFLIVFALGAVDFRVLRHLK